MIRVLNRHLLREFVRGFLTTATVLTLVMYVGATVQAIDYMSRGISAPLILKIFALNVPFTLSFVIPISVLTTVLLQFGRLSADGEITALKACGVSLWQMAAPPRLALTMSNENRQVFRACPVQPGTAGSPVIPAPAGRSGQGVRRAPTLLPPGGAASAPDSGQYGWHRSLRPARACRLRQFVRRRRRLRDRYR